MGPAEVFTALRIALMDAEKKKKVGGRPTARVGARPVVCGTRFSHAEAAQMDAMRGALSRAEWLRWLQLQAVKRLTTPE